MRTSRQFGEVDRFGVKRNGNYLYITLLKKEQKKSRLGITASRRFGSSVIRNRFKRCLREAYRLLDPTIKGDWWIHVKPKVNATLASSRDLHEELALVLNSIK